MTPCWEAPNYSCARGVLLNLGRVGPTGHAAMLGSHMQGTHHRLRISASMLTMIEAQPPDTQKIRNLLQHG